MRNKAFPKRKSQPRTNRSENKTIELIDKIRKFADFEKTILPALQDDVKAGMGPKELRTKYASLVQARIISEALNNPDGGKALVAAADIINRSEGKATEKKEVTHRFDSLSDEELDAVLESETQDLEDLQSRFDN